MRALVYSKFLMVTALARASRGSTTIGDAVKSIQNDSITLCNEAKHLSIISSNSL